VSVVSMIAADGKVFWTAGSTDGMNDAGGVYSAPLAGDAALEIARTSLRPMPLPMFLQGGDVIVSYDVPGTGTQLVAGDHESGGLGYALSNLQGMRAIACDGPFLYLNVTNNGGSILRGQSNGLGVLDIVTLTGGLTFGLAVDASSVYWVAPNAGPLWLWVSPKGLASKGAPVVPTTMTLGASPPLDLVLDDANVYGLDAAGMAIVTMPKQGGSPATQPLDAAAAHPRDPVLASGALFFLADDGIHRASPPTAAPQLVVAGDGTTLSGLAVNGDDIYWGVQQPAATAGNVYCITR
jgi:hypothetical protein